MTRPRSQRRDKSQSFVETAIYRVSCLNRTVLRVYLIPSWRLGMPMRGLPPPLLAAEPLLMHFQPEARNEKDPRLL
ncbi:MAG: hypothetical protein V7K25_20030 [Nostoc sp.]|uniref:hypothetical protein n=1 Tax=Nostoc sp. TaxID=1180 RepID=UPI002FF9D405